MAARALKSLGIAAAVAALWASEVSAQSWVLPPQAEVELAAAVSEVQAHPVACAKLLGASLKPERVELRVELPRAAQAADEPVAPEANKPVPQLWSLRRDAKAPWYELVGAPPCPELASALRAALVKHVRRDPWQQTAAATRAELAGAHVVAPRERDEALQWAAGAMMGLLSLSVGWLRGKKRQDQTES